MEANVERFGSADVKYITELQDCREQLLASPVGQKRIPALVYYDKMVC